MKGFVGFPKGKEGGEMEGRRGGREEGNTLEKSEKLRVSLNARIFSFCVGGSGW